MAVKLIANYSKRLGLPGYSSHQFSVSVETELNTTDDIAHEAERLYNNLQSNVDAQIQNPGFVAPHDYGMESTSNGTPAPGNVLPIADRWACSDKQRDLILKLVDEHGLDKDRIDELATERFGRNVKSLDKLQASGLIEELFDMTGKKNGRAPRRNAYGGGRRS